MSIAAARRLPTQAVPGRHCRDRGSATGWAIGTMLVGLLLTALIVDGGQAMTAKVSALQVAQQAARAGADQIDLVTLRATGDVQLDPAAAETAARQWMAQAGYAGTATATTSAITVTVTHTAPTVLLGAVGIPTFTLSASATAQPVQT